MASSPQPPPVPNALWTGEFVFVCKDASKPPLAPLYRGSYKVLRGCEKFVILQIGDCTDSVSVDRLKPIFSSVPVTPAGPSARGLPWLVLSSFTKPPELICLRKKKVEFFVSVPALKLCWNPCQTV